MFAPAMPVSICVPAAVFPSVSHNWLRPNWSRPWKNTSPSKTVNSFGFNPCGSLAGPLSPPAASARLVGAAGRSVSYPESRKTVGVDAAEQDCAAEHSHIGGI